MGLFSGSKGAGIGTFVPDPSFFILFRFFLVFDLLLTVLGLD